MRHLPCLLLAGFLSAFAQLHASDWPMLGRDNTRNPVSPEQGAPVEWNILTGHNIKWRAPLGDYTSADPVIAGGLVYIGTSAKSSEPSRTPGLPPPVLKCFREADGGAVWEYTVPETNIFSGQWGTPLIASIGRRTQVVAPQGDGWVRSFDALTGQLL